MRRYAVAFVVLAACWQQTTTAPAPGPRPIYQPPAPMVATGGGPRAEFLVAWGDDRSKATTKIAPHQVYAARMVADGTLIDANGIAVDTRQHWGRPLPQVSPTNRGWWVASDLANFTVPTKREFTVSVQHVDANGVVGAAVQASDAMRDGIDFDLATAGDTALVAWAGIRRTKTEAAVINGTQKTPITLPANTGRRPSITYDAISGDFVLAYRESAGATVLVIDRGGTIKATYAIAIGTPSIGDGVEIAGTAAGDLLLTWVEQDGRTMTAARMDIANGQITDRVTLRTSPGTVIRHTLVRGSRGYLIAWQETGMGRQGVGSAWLDGADPLNTPAVAVAMPMIVQNDAMPQFQAGPHDFLVSWTRSGDPLAVRVDASGAVLDTAPLSLRTLENAPVSTAILQADGVSPAGTDYCPRVGNDNVVPPTARGLYVVEGQQPWGTLYIPGFGWGGSTGSKPRLSFYNGRRPEFVPHWKSTAAAGTPNPFELTVEIPDAKRKRTERISVSTDDAASAAAAGIAGPIDLVDFEVNGGLGGKGFHFVVTKSTVVESATVLSKRFTGARAAFDKLVKTSRKELDGVLADAKKAALAANPHPVKGKVPQDESVIYMPTYRPSTGRIEVLFGYRLTEGVMMKFPEPKPSTRPSKHPDMGPLPNPRPLLWGVMMGARITLDGDKIESVETWAPTVNGSGFAVPWECKAPRGHPGQAQPVAACTGPAPGPGYTCVQNCGPPVSSQNDPPPGWSWLSPAEADSRKKHGCPICLPGTARVATPDGDVEISTLREGARVLTLDETGRRIPATVLYAGSTLASTSHTVVRATLADGRVTTGSPGHPRADRGTLGALREGDVVDGSRVIRVERVPLPGDRTWDILPSGPTGLYIIDGVVLRSSFGVSSR